MSTTSAWATRPGRSTAATGLHQLEHRRLRLAGVDGSPLQERFPSSSRCAKGRAHGIFSTTPGSTCFDFGKRVARRVLVRQSDGGELDYYFIYGPDPEERSSRATPTLTGKARCRRSGRSGFQQCRYSYYPESRVYEIAKTFREQKIPADVIYLDIDYQKDNRPFTVETAALSRTSSR